MRRQAAGLILVDFYTDWCGWCKKLDSDVYPDPAVVKATSHYAMVRLNAETDGRELAARYDVHAYPTILFLNESGEIVHKIVGYKPASSFAEELNIFLPTLRKLPGARAEVLAHPDNPIAVWNLAAYDAETNNLPESIKLANALQSNGYVSHMSLLYSEIGTSLLTDSNCTDALAAFRTALRDAKTNVDIADARFGIVETYWKAQKRAELTSAVQTLLATPGVTEEQKSKAQGYLSE